MPKRPKGSIPVELHAAIIEEFEKTGAVPPGSVLAEITGIGPDLVRRAMRGLVERGVLHQPYGKGSPYVPLQYPDGNSVNISVSPRVS